MDECDLDSPNICEDESSEDESSESSDDTESIDYTTDDDTESESEHEVTGTEHEVTGTECSSCTESMDEESDDDDSNSISNTGSDSGSTTLDEGSTFDDCDEIAYNEVSSANMHCAGQPCTDDRNIKSDPAYWYFACNDGIWETIYEPTGSDGGSWEPSETGTEDEDEEGGSCVGPCCHGGSFVEECVGQPCDLPIDYDYESKAAPLDPKSPYYSEIQK